MYSDEPLIETLSILAHHTQLQDEKEHGEGNLQWFEKIEKTVGRKKKNFWICKLPYDSEYGFDCSKIVEMNQESFEEVII